MDPRAHFTSPQEGPVHCPKFTVMEPTCLEVQVMIPSSFSRWCHCHTVILKNLLILEASTPLDGHPGPTTLQSWKMVLQGPTHHEWLLALSVMGSPALPLLEVALVPFALDALGARTLCRHPQPVASWKEPLGVSEEMPPSAVECVSVWTMFLFLWAIDPGWTLRRTVIGGGWGGPSVVLETTGGSPGCIGAMGRIRQVLCAHQPFPPCSLTCFFFFFL